MGCATFGVCVVIEDIPEVHFLPKHCGKIVGGVPLELKASRRVRTPCYLLFSAGVVYRTR